MTTTDLSAVAEDVWPLAEAEKAFGRAYAILAKLAAEHDGDCQCHLCLACGHADDGLLEIERIRESRPAPAATVVSD